MARYNIVYDVEALAELKALRRHDQVAVTTAIDQHLSNQPTQVSRSGIKRLDPPVVANYRLRVGDFRVFYDVDEASRTVFVIAIRFKGRQTLEEQPVVTVIDLDDAGLTLQQVLDSGRWPNGAILRSGGRVVARLEKADELDLEDEVWAHQPEQVARGERARARLANNEGMAHDEVKRQLD